MYLDDGSMVGSLAQLREVVDVLQQYGPAKGLHLSTTKSTVWNLWAVSHPMKNQDPLNRGVKMIMDPGTVLLGAPVSSVEFERQAIQDRVNKVQEIMRRLQLSKDIQS